MAMTAPLQLARALPDPSSLHSVEAGLSSKFRWVRSRAKQSMKFRHLVYFVAGAEELNFTKAADRLHVFSTAVQQANR